MRHVIDLDRAAEEISRRRPGWVARGLIVSATTWRDRAAGWPQPIETDRAQVGDPDSVGVRLSRPPDFELEVILYCGGWTDSGFVTATEGGMFPTRTITTLHAFGEVLDDHVLRVFGLVNPSEE